MGMNNQACRPLTEHRVVPVGVRPYVNGVPMGFPPVVADPEATSLVVWLTCMLGA